MTDVVEPSVDDASPVPSTVTREDVANLAQVSPALVSYVINNGPRPVSKDARRRVEEAMKTLDYRPNAAARALKLGKSNAIGLVLPDISNPYFAEFARELTMRSFGRGYGVLLGDSSNSADRELAEIRSLIDRQVDGIFIISVRPTAALEELRHERVPIVVLDQLADEDSARSVVIDNYGGASAAVQLLLDLGHQDIAHIGGPSGMPGADSRTKAWIDLVGTHSNTDLYRQAPFSRAGGYEAALSLLGSDHKPTAVFVSSDVQAIGLLSACRAQGISVPDQLAIVSFDGTEEAKFSCPPLTTVTQPVTQIADAALAALLDTGNPKHIVIPFELEIRESSGGTFGR